MPLGNRSVVRCGEQPGQEINKHGDFAGLTAGRGSHGADRNSGRLTIAQDSPHGSGAYIGRKKPVWRLGDTEAGKDRGALLFAIIGAKRCRRLMGYHPGAAGEGPGSRSLPSDKKHAVVAVEIARSLRHSSAFQIVRRRYGDEGELADLARDQARVRKGAIANGEVDALFNEIARPLGDERLDNDLGIANAERRELRHDIEAREGGRGADAHHAGRGGLSRTDAGFRCLEIADESHGRFVKVAPGLGQTETAGGAHKKLRTEIFFERGNLVSYPRLPCPKLARNPRKAPAIDDAHEYLDAFEPIHPILLRGMLRRSGMTRTFNTPQSGRSRAAEMGKEPPVGYSSTPPLFSH